MPLIFGICGAIIGFCAGFLPAYIVGLLALHSLKGTILGVIIFGIGALMVPAIWYGSAYLGFLGGGALGEWLTKKDPFYRRFSVGLLMAIFLPFLLKGADFCWGIYKESATAKTSAAEEASHYPSCDLDYVRVQQVETQLISGQRSSFLLSFKLKGEKLGWYQLSFMVSSHRNSLISQRSEDVELRAPEQTETINMNISPSDCGQENYNVRVMLGPEEKTEGGFKAYCQKLYQSIDFPLNITCAP